MTPEEQNSSIIELLNKACRLDPAMMHTVRCFMAQCNEAFKNDNSFRANISDPDFNYHYVTFSTLLNDILMAAGIPKIRVKWSQTPDHTGRYKFLGFEKES